MLNCLPACTRPSCCSYAEMVPPAAAMIACLVALVAAAHFRSYYLCIPAGVGTLGAAYALYHAYTTRNLATLYDNVQAAKGHVQGLKQQLREQQETNAASERIKDALQEEVSRLQEMLRAQAEEHAVMFEQHQQSYAQHAEDLLAQKHAAEQAAVNLQAQLKTMGERVGDLNVVKASIGQLETLITAQGLNAEVQAEITLQMRNMVALLAGINLPAQIGQLTRIAEEIGNLRNLHAQYQATGQNLSATANRFSEEVNRLSTISNTNV